ncbi:MAG: prepilin-type N-terminal cleavage/methylation domain-containing protein [Myxococcales bacterium]|nr:prepilin-type N-terminal cleavage/methylation domain-containing protein [Myxococcales bacterium]
MGIVQPQLLLAVASEKVRRRLPSGTTNPLSRGPRGVTLVELMLALAIAFIVIAAIYVLYQTSVRGYRVQSQIVDMQTQLRFGIDHLKSDLRRAGHMATANNRTDSSICWAPANVNLYAFSLERGEGFVANAAQNINIFPSAITLFGDFFSPQGLGFDAVEISGNVVQLALSPTVVSMSQNEFETVFRPGIRWLRVENVDGVNYWYAAIDSVNYADRQITLQQSPGVGPCNPSAFGLRNIAPVGWIRYRLAEDTRTADLVGEVAQQQLFGKTDLIREEVDISGDSVANTQLVIAEYAVDLQFYDFGFDTAIAGSPAQITVLPLVSDVVSSDGATGFLSPLDEFATPERLRFLTVKLSVRSPVEEEELIFQTRQVGNSDAVSAEFAPIRTFELNPDLVGAARVESLAGRVSVLRTMWLR